MKNTYDTMTKEQLMEECFKKDIAIEAYLNQIKNDKYNMLTKSDIMVLFHCENDKALKILKIMYQMGYGNKIGKEYYVSKSSQEDFVNNNLFSAHNYCISYIFY